MLDDIKCANGIEPSGKWLIGSQQPDVETTLTRDCESLLGRVDPDDPVPNRQRLGQSSSPAADIKNAGVCGYVAPQGGQDEPLPAQEPPK